MLPRRGWESGTAATQALILKHQAVNNRQDEQIHLGESEIYVHYGSGMGRSKLRIPAAGAGTARNLNTVAKLMEMASKTSKYVG